MHKSRCFEDRKAMGGRTWRLMHHGHSRGSAFLQFFLCLWGVSPAVSASVSQFGQHGAIVARGKPPLAKAVRGLFRSCGTSSSGRKPTEGLGTHHGPCIGTAQCPPSPAHSVDVRGGSGCPGNHAKSTKLHATSVQAEGSANHLLAITWNRPFSPSGRF